ncbi:MAG: rRNA maturation RNase YbeY [Neisseria sp.]|nr:rRNA maturation RNase YbeY [Neisseria sp.]
MKHAKKYPFTARRAKRLAFSLHNRSSVSVPRERDFLRWIFAVLNRIGGDAEIALMLCDEAQARAYNRDFRGKDYATNVLSFELETGDDRLPERLCGDLLMCPQVVAREAQEQGKDLAAHYAHLTVHGVLHLAGFDHIEDADAEEMEKLEIHVLNQLGYKNPYL